MLVYWIIFVLRHSKKKRQRTLERVALSFQSKSHVARFGVPPLLLNLLDADEHVRAAVELRHPFDMLPTLP
eukprot:5936774-Karenia_brevis.AAC.1